MAMQGKLEDFYDQVAFKYDDNKGNSCMYPYLIRGMVAAPFEQVSVLDIGAGTGTVAQMLLDAGVGSVTLMEPSQAMMNIAKGKLKSQIQNKRVFTKLDGLPNMDFEDSSFHAAMIIQAIHFADEHETVTDATDRHPSSEACKIYPGIFKSFQQTLRILKPGGVLIITTGLPHQLRYSRWYAEFFPWRVAHSYPREPNKEEFDVLLKAAGFEDTVYLVDTSCPLIDDSVLHDPYGIEKEEWRVGDSDFLSLTEKELEQVLNDVRNARENGDLEGIMERAKKNRETMGQMTVIVARKL